MDWQCCRGCIERYNCLSVQRSMKMPVITRSAYTQHTVVRHLEHGHVQMAYHVSQFKKTSLHPPTIQSAPCSLASQRRHPLDHITAVDLSQALSLRHLAVLLA
jgi:hypothetical protein